MEWGILYFSYERIVMIISEGVFGVFCLEWGYWRYVYWYSVGFVIGRSCLWGFRYIGVVVEGIFEDLEGYYFI